MRQIKVSVQSCVFSHMHVSCFMHVGVWITSLCQEGRLGEPKIVVQTSEQLIWSKLRQVRYNAVVLTMVSVKCISEVSGTVYY